MTPPETHHSPRIIGLIGVGLLGTAIAERLRNDGYTLVGFDANPARLEAFRQLGGTACESCEEVVRGIFEASRNTATESSAPIILSLPTSHDVRDVVQRLMTVIPPATKSSTHCGPRRLMVIDTTTGSAEAAEAMSALLALHDVDWMDATVAGSSQQMRQGEAILMVGATSDSFNAQRSLLAALGKHSFHVGPVGSGARMKLVVNLVIGLHRAVLAEALSLARAMHLDLHLTLQILQSSAAKSAVMDTKGEKMISGDFRPAARLAQHSKDVGLILDAGATLEQSLPLSQLHQKLLHLAIEKGHGGDDNSAIIRAFEP